MKWTLKKLRELGKRSRIPKKKQPILIRNYGMYWDPDLIRWTGPKNLPGRFRATQAKPEVNVFQQRGIYVLYKNFKPVYVGKAIAEPLGERLRKHSWAWGKGPRWDRFSWFGIAEIDKTTGKLMKTKSLGRLNTRLRSSQPWKLC